MKTTRAFSAQNGFLSFLHYKQLLFPLLNDVLNRRWCKVANVITIKKSIFSVEKGLFNKSLCTLQISIAILVSLLA